MDWNENNEKKLQEVVNEPIENDIVIPYESKAYQARENMSSSIILIIMGMLGIIFLFLCKIGIISLRLNIMFYIVLGSLFIIFLILGTTMMVKSKKLYAGIDEEDTLVYHVKSWVLENCKQVDIDQAIQNDDEEDSEEVKYFKRTQYIKNAINEKFLNLEDGFVDYYIDELYEKIFES